MEIEEVKLAVVGMMVECDCWHVIDRNEGRTGTIRKAPKLDCVKCQGTGQVPRFSMLRRWCSKCLRTGQICRPQVWGKSVFDNCPDCHGLGYIPSDNVNDWLDVAARLRPDFVLQSYIQKDGFLTWIAEYKHTDFWAGIYDTPLEAICRLVLAACEAMAVKGEA